MKRREEKRSKRVDGNKKGRQGGGEEGYI